jgi:hypothetical protein
MKIMLDAPLKPEKHLTAEEVGRLVGCDERLVRDMYRAQLIDAAALRQGKAVFSEVEAHRWKKWYLEHRNDYERCLWASEKILTGFFAAGASVSLMLGVIGLWRQGIPVLLALSLILPAVFLVPLPRPRPGRRFQQVQVTVAGAATGLFLAELLQPLLGHGESGSGHVGFLMLVCLMVCYVLDRLEFRTEECELAVAPGMYASLMMATGALALSAGGPTLGVNIGVIPALIVGAAIFGAAALAQLMRKFNTHAFGITVPVAAFFGWEVALVTLFAVAGLLVICSLAQRYFDEPKDVSLAELLMR